MESVGGFTHTFFGIRKIREAYCLLLGIKAVSKVHCLLLGIRAACCPLPGIRAACKAYRWLFLFKVPCREKYAAKVAYSEYNKKNFSCSIG